MSEFFGLDGCAHKGERDLAYLGNWDTILASIASHFATDSLKPSSCHFLYIFTSNSILGCYTIPCLHSFIIVLHSWVINMLPCFLMVLIISRDFVKTCH